MTDQALTGAMSEIMTYPTTSDLNSNYYPEPLSNEAQSITEGGSGLTSFTLTYAGQTTASIDDDATAAQVRLALEALSNIAVGDVAVTGGPLEEAPFIVKFVGTLAGTNVAQMSATPTGGTGTVTIATATPGADAEQNPDSDEVQTVTEGGSGLTSFTLTYAGQTTGSIAAGASAAAVQTALIALSNLALGDVVVTGADGGPFTVTFGGTLAGTNVAQMTATPTGGTGTVTVATLTPGGVTS